MTELSSAEHRTFFFVLNSMASFHIFVLLNDPHVCGRVIQTYVVNYICQKVQKFWPDSDYMGKINIKKNFIFFFSMFSFA
jgi:hypothetical protein